MGDNPEGLRQQVGHVLNDALLASSPQVQRQLAEKAFEIAQRAEVIERLNQKAAKGLTTKILIEQLYQEMDANQRKICRDMLIREERNYSLKAERLERLQQLAVDCAHRVSRLRLSLDQSRTEGACTEQDPLLLKNSLGVQEFLNERLRKELADETQSF